MKRFTEKWELDPVKGCWLWMGGTRRGYGAFWYKGRTVQAHRVSYELYVGMISKDLDLDHTCRVRHCVNPAHLEPVTNKENVLRGEGHTAVNARKTHCPKGHPFTGPNLVLISGKRRCRQCKNAHARASYRARRSA